MPDSSRCDVFISYRREGGEALAMLLHDRLADAGYRVFLDVESLRSGNFNEAILGKIEECTDMLVLLPPNALDRCVNEDDWVRREVEHAFLHGKNIVPVMMRGFSWPESLPEGLSALPSCNGVTADNMELFDGILLRIQDKLLRSKPVLQQMEDPEFTRMLHRFQFLMFSQDLEAADKIVRQLMEQYPDRAESYLCRVQHKYQAANLELLGMTTDPFEEDPAWKYALHIAPPELQARLEKLLADSLALREKQAEEARREAEIRKLQEPRRKPAKETPDVQRRQTRKEEATRIRDEVVRRVEQFNPNRPVTPQQIGEVYELRDMITSIEDVFQMPEAVAALNQLIDGLLKEAAERAMMAKEILSCYAVLGWIQGVHQKLAGKSIPRDTIIRKDVQHQEGIVQCCMRNNCCLALLADGSVVPLDAATQTWLGNDAHRWTEIVWLDSSMAAGVRGFRKDGTYVFAADEAQPGHYECEPIADSPYEYRASGIRLHKPGQAEWYTEYPDGRSEMLARGVCYHWRVPAGLLLLTANGRLTLHEDRLPEMGYVLKSDVIGFYIGGNTCFALLQNGHVAEIDLTTQECREFSCAMTEEAVQKGVQNWRRHNAERMLVQLKRELMKRSPSIDENPWVLAFPILAAARALQPMFGKKRREACQRSIDTLKALLAEQ